MNCEEREELIAKYKEGFSQVAESLEGFPADHLTARPVQGKWSAAEIVHHLADSEMTAAIRLRLLLCHEYPVIHGYDQDHFAGKLAYNERDIEPALDAFRSARVVTAQLLEGMTEEDWQREGWHTESGSYSVTKWLSIYACHAHDHAAQIAGLKEILTKRDG